MSFRTYLNALQSQTRISQVIKPISKFYEIAGVLKNTEPSAVFFSNVKESPFPVVGNLFCTKNDFSIYFGVEKKDIIPFIIKAIDNRSTYPIITHAPCQDVIITNPDLNLLPILRHCEKDGGNYISSGIVISRHPQYGQNMDFHRCMQISSDKMAVRVVRGRHFDFYLNELQQIDVAICIGNSPNILIAAALSVELGIDELQIAHSLEPFQAVRAKTVDLLVPAESEFVIEGTIYLNKTHPEGPFVDLTETYDLIRQEPVLEVKAITHRRDPIWHALIPAGLEHKMLMGMPREPTIYKKVNEVVKCLDVNITPGGCSWLHAVVQIKKEQEDDGRKAIQAAFLGHSSCKHVFIVDDDIDIYQPEEVEWAMATRFQGDTDLIMRKDERGSSLDPSANPDTNITTKIGFDLTKPLHRKGKSFEKAAFPKVDLRQFLDE